MSNPGLHMGALLEQRLASRARHAWSSTSLSLGQPCLLCAPLLMFRLLERRRLHGGVRGQSALMHLQEPLCEVQAHAQHVRVTALDEVGPGRQVPGLIIIIMVSAFSLIQEIIILIFFPVYQL